MAARECNLKMMRTRFPFLFPVLFCALCGATNSPAQSVAESAPVQLPLEYSNGHLFVEVDEAQLGRLHMLLDSGAERTYMSAAPASKVSSSHRTISIIGGGPGNPDRAYRTARVDLRFGERILFSGDALVLPVDGQLSAGLNHRVDGALGWDFFERWCVRIDYATQTVTLTEPDRCTAPASPHAVLSGDWSHHGFSLPTEVTFTNSNSVHADLHVDTGTDASLSLRPKFREAAGLHGGTKETAMPGVGANGAFTSDLVPFKRIDIGGGKLTLGDGHIVIGRAGSFTKTHWWSNGIGEAALNSDGEIGNAILSHAVVTFDPVRHCLYLEENPTTKTQGVQ